MLLERPSHDLFISLCSLGVYFTDSDTGIYSKGVRDMRAFCVIVIGKTTRTYCSESIKKFCKE